MSNEANKLGLTIIPSADNHSFEDINQLSVFRMKKLLELEEEYVSLSSFGKHPSNILDGMKTTDGKLHGIIF